MTARQPELTTNLRSKNRLRLWLKLLKTTNAVADELRRRMRSEFDSTLPRFDVMSALERYPDGLKMYEISSLLQVSNGNVTGIVDRLVEDGMAARRAVPGDRRASRVQLTHKGQVKFSHYAQEHRKWVDELLGNLQSEEAETLTRTLDTILEGAAK